MITSTLATSTARFLANARWIELLGPERTYAVLGVAICRADRPI
jgi:hypothetical protein